jgi:hypothetical protein
MRLLAPLLVVDLTVLGSGLLLLRSGRIGTAACSACTRRGFVAWGVLFGVHVLVYLPRLPRLVPRGRTLRTTALIAGSLLAGRRWPLGVLACGPWAPLARPPRESATAAERLQVGDEAARSASLRIRPSGMLTIGLADHCRCGSRPRSSCPC